MINCVRIVKKSLIRSIISLIMTVASMAPVYSQNDAVFKMSINRAMDEVYDNVYTSLEEARFYVVFEPNIGNSLKQFAKRWGDDYNQNELTSLRSLVFCNGWYANQVSNKDPDMLGVCPLHLTLYEQKGQTTALFNRPTAISSGSPADSIFEEIENKVINAIKKGMQK